MKGKVVIDAFRTINTQMIMLGQEPRQTTSNLGHLQKPSIQGQFIFAAMILKNIFSALIHGLNRHYYSMPIVYRKNEHEQQMLMNLHKSKWQDSLSIADFEKCKQKNIESINNMVKLAKVRFQFSSGPTWWMVTYRYFRTTKTTLMMNQNWAKRSWTLEITVKSIQNDIWKSNLKFSMEKTSFNAFPLCCQQSYSNSLPTKPFFS